MDDKNNKLTLKWGTLKAWHFHTPKGLELLKEYHNIGSSLSAMTQKDTPRQKEIILELIDEADGTIHNDWEGTEMSKAEAKNYVLNYGKAL